MLSQPAREFSPLVAVQRHPVPLQRTQTVPLALCALARTVHFTGAAVAL